MPQDRNAPAANAANAANAASNPAAIKTHVLKTLHNSTQEINKNVLQMQLKLIVLKIPHKTLLNLMQIKHLQQ